ncbi:MAG: hypothetical protein RL272_521 [Candidatus Parcubacteria bacterium]
MTWERPAKRLGHGDRHVFGKPVGLALIVGYKGMWGMIEVIAGVLVLFSYRYVTRELIEDPQDLLSNWLLAHVDVTRSASIKLGTVIVGLGMGKLILAACLWHWPWTARRFAIGFFCLVAAFGTYRLLSGPFSVVTEVAVLLDVFIIWSFAAILPEHLGDAGVE